jgi:hypothetical protein
MLTFSQWLKIPEFQNLRRPVNVAQYLEWAGAAMCTTGVYLIAGLGVALIVGATALIVAAEFIYGDPVLIHVPRPPHPFKRIRGWIK